MSALIYDNWASGDGTVTVGRVGSDGAFVLVGQMTSSGASTSLQLRSAVAPGNATVSTGQWMYATYAAPAGNPNQSSQICQMQVTIQRI